MICLNNQPAGEIKNVFRTVGLDPHIHSSGSSSLSLSVCTGVVSSMLSMATIVSSTFSFDTVSSPLFTPDAEQPAKNIVIKLRTVAITIVFLFIRITSYKS